MKQGVRFGSLAVALAASAGMGFAQLSSTLSLSNGVNVQLVTSLGSPTGEEKLSVEMARASGNSFYRIFRDQNKLAVFAYELAVDRSGDGSEFHFTAKPAETDFAASFPNADAGKPVPSLSTDHEFQPLHSGEHDEIGLFEIPGMGLKVTDSIEVTLSPDGGTTGSAGPLRFDGLKISSLADGAAGPARGSVSGRYLMFYLPEHGGYFFSTDAPPGRAFVKAGSIDKEHMQFSVENDSYECTSEATIQEDGGSGEIWVYHDPAYKPAGNWTQDIRDGETAKPAEEEFFTAASNSLDWWLPSPTP